jgi:hypothetical protein
MLLNADRPRRGWHAVLGRQGSVSTGLAEVTAAENSTVEVFVKKKTSSVVKRRRKPGTMDIIMQRQLEKIPLEIAIGILFDKMIAMGVPLHDSQRRQIRSQVRAHLRQGGKDILVLQLSHPEPRSMAIDWTPGDSAALEEKVNHFLNQQLPAIIRETCISAAPELRKRLDRKWPSVSKSRRLDRAGFESRLHERWGEGIEQLHMLLTIAEEFGADCNQRLRRPGKLTAVADIVTRLHGRACQTTREILVLLEGGLADGAMARWRTLHEIAAVGIVIRSHGEEIAHRYLDHANVEARKAALKYRDVYEKLGYEAIPESELASIESSYQDVLKKHGKTFKEEYGWASEALHNPRPNFSDIERAAGLSHLRSHVQMAHNNVHSGVRGAFVRLGLMNYPGILAGPSNAGLADPGHNAAISLSQVTSTLGLLLPSMDINVSLFTIVKLVDDIGRSFQLASERLDAEELARQRLNERSRKKRRRSVEG